MKIKVQVKCNPGSSPILVWLISKYFHSDFQISSEVSTEVPTASYNKTVSQLYSLEFLWMLI